MLPSKLLLSLQSANELRFVQGMSFPWLDLKNPAKGSLGCPEFRAASEFLDAFDRSFDRGQCCLSMAVGELRDEHWTELLPIAAGFDFVKVALAGCLHDPKWETRATQLATQLDSKEKLILVHYADHQRAEAPDWQATLDAAFSLGSQFLLIDTCHKYAGRLWDWYPNERIREFAKEANAKGIQLSIAGSLRLEELKKARTLGAAVVGVRGAACLDSSRTLGLCRDRLMQLSKLFAE